MLFRNLAQHGMLLASTLPLSKAMFRSPIKLDVELSARSESATTENASKPAATPKPYISPQCAKACATLLSTFQSSQVDSVGVDAYQTDQAQYWSKFAEDVQPACFFHPYNKHEVAAAIKLADQDNCRFVVVSGGHTPFKDGSTAEGGITITFSNMKNVTVSDDRSLVSIEPGNRWYDVYKALEPASMNVIGGRVAHVGTAGLLLGGGISYFSNRYGWAMDNIANYEVVLVSGEIIDVNNTTNPDLYWALRGGGGNFGIITRFDLLAYEQQPLFWSGDRVVDSTIYNNTILDAVLDWATSGWVDNKSAIEIAFAYVQEYGLWIQESTLTHMDPQPNGSHPAAFDGWYKANVTLRDKEGNIPPTELTQDLESANGKRQLVYTMTVEPDRQLASDILEIWRQEVTPMVNFSDILPALQFQPQTPNIFQAMRRNGGNCVGLQDRNSTLLILNWSIGWSDPADDAAVNAAYARVTQRVTELSQARGLFHPFKYANYAHPSQDPIATYGEENKQRLLKISHKYDPTGVLQRNPGQFKLNGSPPQTG
ncbi:hypothetical protein PG999_008570 [Apiospora kogelbergensis]|uniref:FAD-binding PCMH-type domain-containing protein n=1 Tax=Apiospora kogelbergensis TaxID=1337665 RepID=A0AAW0QRP8_9PEZI